MRGLVSAESNRRRIPAELPNAIVCFVRLLLAFDMYAGELYYLLFAIDFSGAFGPVSGC